MRLIAIPAGVPFLDALAAWVLAETPGGAPGDAPGGAPERLARTTILLPTRRAARALRAAFLRVAAPSGPAGLLLPRMQALAGLSAEEADELALPALLELPPAVAPLRRQAVLTGFVQRLLAARGEPSAPAQAWPLAAALAQLFDEMALEEGDPEAFAAGQAPAALWLRRLEALVPAEHAAHWGHTIAFLRGAMAAWQGWLDAEGLLDVGPRRVLALRAQAAAWRATPPADPVIAAGIGLGGLIPAATELLRAIVRLPAGAVVLHGLGDAPDAARDAAILETPTHPEHGPLRLLAALGAARGDLRPWAPPAIPLHAPAGRAALVGTALLPAASLGAWQQCDPARWRPTLDGLTVLEAADAQAEAVAIALLLREALEAPSARAALVTPDRDLARRVAAELARHGVVADDSAGQPLGESPAGAFLRLLAAAVAEGLAPVPLLAALKHPLASGGWDRTDWIDAVRRLERAALRGPRPAAGLAGLRAAAAASLSGAHADPAALATIERLLERVAAVLGDFATLPPSPARPAADLLADHLAAAEALAATATLPGGIALYRGEEGETLAEHLAALADAMAVLPPMSPADWPALFDAALADAAAPALHASRGRPAGPHPRVEILGLFEARLLAFDRVVLGALEEGVWPLATESGPWLSRPMRRDFGLPSPEARIGRVAGDFLHAACAAPDAVLSRARKREGAPTVPARWLTRLETFLGGQDGLRLPVSRAGDWAAALDRPDGPPRPCARPRPSPPAEARPDTLSVTEVETLVADPYAFYAKRVLRLRALSPLDEEAGAPDYGQLVHATMADFLGRLGTGWPGDAAAAAAFAAASEAALAAAAARPGLLAFWRPRLARIGGFVLGLERAARDGAAILRTSTETSGELALRHDDGRVVRLTVRADRIDLRANGRLAITDYKTGGLPSAKAVVDGHRPQLPLEAAIAAEGGFAGLAAADVEALVYWRLAGGGTVGEVAIPAKDAAAVQTLAAAAKAGVQALALRFLWGDAPFLARPHAGRAPAGDDYDHLSRLAEWSGSAGGEA